jgi:hypothetical protein
VGLERGPLSLVSTIEGLLGRKSSGSGLENREYGCGGEVSMCDTPPTLKTVHVSLVQHFIEGTVLQPMI